MGADQRLRQGFDPANADRRSQAEVIDTGGAQSQVAEGESFSRGLKIGTV